MAPVLMILGPGLLGGLLVAVLILYAERHRVRRNSPPPLPYHSEPLSTDVINMASIKVAGVGGLGLVAMAAAVALDVPRIGQSVILGFVLGAALAIGMIVRRRRTGSMPSSGQQMGANTTLSIDTAGTDHGRSRANGAAPLPSAIAHPPLAGTRA